MLRKSMAFVPQYQKFESGFLHRRVRCEPNSLVAHNARHMMLLAVKSAVAEDEQAVVALWRACDLVASYNDPVADFRFAKAGPCSDVLVAVVDAGKEASSGLGRPDG